MISVEPPLLVYNDSDYFETSSGNKVCKKITLLGSQNITLTGKTILMKDVIVRGDLANVKIGRNCLIRERVVLRPPYKKMAKGLSFMPLIIGDNVYIDEDSVVNSSSISPWVHVGKNCVLGRRSVIKECCIILPGTVISHEEIVPPLSIMSGNPGKRIGTVPACFQESMIDLSRATYANFVPNSQVTTDPDKLVSMPDLHMVSS